MIAAAVVAQEIARIVEVARRLDDSRRYLLGNGEALARPERARRLNREHAVRDGAAPVGAARTVGAGVGNPAHRRSLIRQRHADERRCNRKGPGVAGHVPVKLRVILEPADLAVGLVGEDVGVAATTLKENALLAGIDADVFALALREVRLGLPIARDGEELEADFVHLAVGILEGEREVAIDAALDLVALGADLDGLGDVQRAVPRDGDVGAEAFDRLFRGRRRRGHEEGGEQCEKRRSDAEGA